MTLAERLRQRRWWIAGAAAAFVAALAGSAVLFSGGHDGGTHVAEVVIPLPPARPAGGTDEATAPRAGDGNWLKASKAAEAAYAALPSAPKGPALPPAPDRALVEKHGDLQLPRISADGRPPFRVYARPFTADERRPRIAVVIIGLALSGTATDAAIRALPGAITLAVSPYGAQACEAVAAARLASHEALIMLPFQPADARAGDAGPLAIADTMTVDDAIARLNGVLGRCSGYTGVVGRAVGHIDGSAPLAAALLRTLRDRGLLYVDEETPSLSTERFLTESGVPWAGADVRIDDNPARRAIDEQLQRLEDIARRRGSAVGIAGSTPLSLARIAAWAARVEERDLQLAPVSAVVVARRGA